MRTPTSEQQVALDAFAAGHDLVIEAGAGSGKTSTLEMLAQSTNRRGIYLAFNKAIAEEASSRFPHTVDCRTISSVAFRAVGRELHASERLGMPRIPTKEVARILGIDPITVQLGEDKPRVLTASFLAAQVMRGVSLFCQSGDAEISVQHWPHCYGIDAPDSEGKPNNVHVRERMLPFVVKAWEDLIHPQGQLRFTHDIYLKVFQLRRIALPGDYILFDEAQDANPVMLAIVEQQDRRRQRVYVGDSQQQIYEWRGAVNALSTLEGARAYLTQSFRFGPAIADAANRVLEILNADLRMTGLASIASVVDAVELPDALLCRSNAGCISSIIQAQKAGQRTALVGRNEDLVHFVRECGRLHSGQRSEHPELACFETWADLAEYVENDPSGEELRTIVAIVESYTAPRIVAALLDQVSESQADITISTAHKAKGREWSSVQLHRDFDSFDPENGFDASELRLLYVAVTRAKNELDVTQAESVQRLIDGAPIQRADALTEAESVNA